MKRSSPEEVAKAASGKRAAATTSGASARAKRAKKGTAFGDQLGRMVDNPLCADVELLVGQEGTSIYASKVILVARSPVFEALLGGNFREGQPPPPSSSSSSASSSSLSVASSSEASSSTSLAPVFWHRAEIGDMEPRTMRHLLHCLYTDQLHPDLITPPSPSSSAQVKQKTSTTNNDDNRDDEDEGNDEDLSMTQQERDLVALFVAADRYLVDKAQTLVRRELMRRFSAGDYSNVLPVFDQALALAPELATRACQPVIEARATQILANQDDAMEARWLGLSDTAAARVVGMDLEGIEEIYLFRAIQRRYEHHFAEAMGPDNDDDGDGEGKDNSDDKKRKEEQMKKKKKKREAAIAGAKKKVAGLIKGIKTSLLGVNALSMVVEPSGLFTNAQLIAAYRNAALTHRYVIKDLSVCPAHSFHDVQAHGKIRWSLGVHRTNAIEHTVYFHIKPGTELSPRLPDLSAKGVMLTIYCDRRRVQTFFADATTVVAVPGTLEFPFTARPNSGRVTIIVRVPPTAFTKAAR